MTNIEVLGRSSAATSPHGFDSGAKTYTLLGPDRRSYESTVKGILGGHRRDRVYGTLDCPAAARALKRGGYRAERVFFADEPTAVAAGYRPCAACLPVQYAAWRARQQPVHAH